MNINFKDTLRKGVMDMRLIMVVAIGLFFAIYIGTVAGAGDFQKTSIYIVLVIMGIVIFTMRRSYWMFIPFAMIGDFPTVPLGGISLKMGEAWLLLSIFMMALNCFTNARFPKLYQKGALPIYLYVAWVAMIFVMNPVGLSSMGAGSGGFRFYLKIGLALSAVVLLMNQEIDEKRAQKVLKLVVIGTLLGTLWNIAQIFVPQLAWLTGRSAANSDSFYSWQQQLVVLPHVVVLFIVSRFNLGELLRPNRFWLIFIGLICVLLAFASGKRSLALIVLMLPALSSVVRKRFLEVFIGGAMGVLIIAVAIVGHRGAFDLPKQAQRVLSVIPGVDLDADVEASAENGFRETLNKYALDEIEQRPILGEGLQVDFELLFELHDNPGNLLQEGDHYLGLTYSANSNWHNTWLGIAADFGIPAAIIWAWIWLAFVFGCGKTLKQFDRKDWRYTIVMFILLWTLGDIARSWQFGHSAVNPWQIGWRIGVLLAVRNSIPRMLRNNQQQTSQPTQRNRSHMTDHSSRPNKELSSSR